MSKSHLVGSSSILTESGCLIGIAAIMVMLE